MDLAEFDLVSAATNGSGVRRAAPDAQRAQGVDPFDQANVVASKLRGALALMAAADRAGGRDGEEMPAAECLVRDALADLDRLRDSLP